MIDTSRARGERRALGSSCAHGGFRRSSSCRAAGRCGRANAFRKRGSNAFHEELLGRHRREAGVEVWAWVLLPNHVHSILNPSDLDGFRRAFSPAHRRRRLHSCAVREDRAFLAGSAWFRGDGRSAFGGAGALRRAQPGARPVDRAGDWRWSSAKADLTAREDGATLSAPVLDRFPRVADLLEDGGRRRTADGVAAGGDHRKSARRRGVLGRIGDNPRASDPREAARPDAQNRGTG